MGGGAGRLPGRDVKRAGTFFVPSGKAGYRFAQPGSRLKRVVEFKKKPVKCWARQDNWGIKGHTYVVPDGLSARCN